MNIILVSIPLSMILVGLGVWAFFWAVNSGQYDDLDSPAYSILTEDEDLAQAERAAEEQRQRQE